MIKSIMDLGRFVAVPPRPEHGLMDGFDMIYISSSSSFFSIFEGPASMVQTEKVLSVLGVTDSSVHR